MTSPATDKLVHAYNRMMERIRHAFEEAEARALPSAELRLIEGAGHFDLVHPATPAFQVLLAALDEVLGR